MAIPTSVYPPPLIVPASGSVLEHVSRTAYRDRPLWFGRDGNCRFDDPERAYGVLYLGFELATSLMESVFHQHEWESSTPRNLAQAELDRRMVRFVGQRQDLLLADLTAPGVMASLYGLSLHQMTSRTYTRLQAVSASLHAAVDVRGVPAFDGILYPSRNNYPAKCIALFDRAASKIDWITDVDLALHTDWAAFVARYQIVITP